MTFGSLSAESYEARQLVSNDRKKGCMRAAVWKLLPSGIILLKIISHASSL